MVVGFKLMARCNLLHKLYSTLLMKKELKSINKTEKRKTNIYVKKTKTKLKTRKTFPIERQQVCKE